MKTHYVLTDECELSSDGWCFTHSTGKGPIYCAPWIPGAASCAHCDGADFLAVPCDGCGRVLHVLRPPTSDPLFCWDCMWEDA